MAELPPASLITPVEHAVARTSSATAFDTCRGFHVSTSEAITVTMKSGASVSMTVVSGGCYAYQIKAFTSGAGTILTLY